MYCRYPSALVLTLVIALGPCTAAHAGRHGRDERPQPGYGPDPSGLVARPYDEQPGADEPRGERDAEPPKPAMSLDAAAAMVRERTRGRVVRAERTAESDRIVYAIRVLTGDGRVRTYRVDAQTGQMR